MDKLVSSLSSTVKTLPKDYVLPVELRPGDAIMPLCNTVPVIDLHAVLARGRDHAVQQVLEALQDFGFFQVINHGLAEDLVIDTMRVVKEFFDLPNEDKASFFSRDPKKEVRLYTSIYNYNEEQIHSWRDVLRLPCHPIDNYVHLWPQKPDRYQDVVKKYSLQMASLSSTILGLIYEGLGLEPSHFGDGLSGDPIISTNHYPSCPSPDLALGLLAHCDPNLITFLQQDAICGLQMYINGEWLGIEPIPNAFVVIIGQQGEVISNGMLTSPKHRVLTHSTNHRTSIAYSVFPKPDTMMEPAKVLINDSNPPLYQSFQFKTFIKTYLERKDSNEDVLEHFKIKA